MFTLYRLLDFIVRETSFRYLNYWYAESVVGKWFNWLFAAAIGLFVSEVLIF
jgi:hypothetical protein